jgi:hypothetical protein
MKTIDVRISWKCKEALTIEQIESALSTEYIDTFHVRKLPAQDQVNARYLLGAIDRIHSALCPGRSGTWQMRVEQAVAAAEKLPAQPEQERAEEEQPI